MNNWRLALVIVIMTLCVLDLAMTYAYVYKYKRWQPNKPYRMIERNPVLRILWEKFGLHLGMFIGAVLILALNYIVAKEAHWIVVGLLLGLLLYTMYNHFTNIGLLYNLVIQYPSGYLPEETFGKVIGSNPNPQQLNNDGGV